MVGGKGEEAYPRLLRDMEGMDMIASEILLAGPIWPKLARSLAAVVDMVRIERPGRQEGRKAGRRARRNSGDHPKRGGGGEW